MGCADASSNDREEILTKYQREEMLTEYQALRGETLARLQTQHQIITFTILFLGAILAFGTGDKMSSHARQLALFAYPVMVMFLAVGYYHNVLRVGEIGIYIRRNIEPALTGLRWEGYMSGLRSGTFPREVGWPSGIRGLFGMGVFIGTQMMSFLLACLSPAELDTLRFVVALGIDMVAVFMTILLSRMRAKIDKSLFSIDSKFKSDLDNKSISNELSKEFQKRHFPLSNNLLPRTEQKGSSWLITDKDNKRKYVIRKEEAKLNIYLG